MKLKTAIKILTEGPKVLPGYYDPDYNAALKLLIEAGKRIEQQRHYFWAYRESLLPGETKE